MSDSQDPMNDNPPGFSDHGISQARKLEWVANSFSRGIPNAGIEPMGLLHWQADSLPTELPGNPMFTKYLLISGPFNVSDLF